MTVATGSILTTSVAMVIYPRMAQEYGRSHDARATMKLARRPRLFLILAGIPVVVLGWILLAPITEWLLPNYLRGVPAAQWSLLTVYALGFTAGFPIFNVTRQQVLYAVAILLGIAVFAAAVPLMRGLQEDPLLGYAQAMLLGTFVFVVAGNALSLVAVRRTGIRSPGKILPAKDEEP